MSNDPTKPEFFALWSIIEMQVELARLNKVLAEVSEITVPEVKEEK
jgi:hypothetical protein